MPKSRTRFSRRQDRHSLAVAALDDARSKTVVVVTAVLALGLLLAAPGEARETSETFTFDGRELAVANLIGAIEVVESSTSSFKVTAYVRGEDSDQATVDFEQRDGSQAKLMVNFPVDSYTRYVYPDYNGNTTLRRSRDSKSLLGKLIGALTSDSIKVSGKGQGLELWVDLTIEVPSGANLLTVDNGVGNMSASGVDADLYLKTRSGKLFGTGLKGDSTFDLGSGQVRLSDYAGELSVDTGSGSVSLEGFDGPTLSIDTGSGQVNLAGVRTRHLNVDTGSGGVSAEGVAAEDATIDTGSGHVKLALTEMGTGDFSIDTGSGGITLLLPDYASASIDAETGSGGIDIGLDDVKVLHRERREMRFEVGKGDARVILDTGSGRIKIASVDR